MPKKSKGPTFAELLKQPAPREGDADAAAEGLRLGKHCSNLINIDVPFCPVGVGHVHALLGHLPEGGAAVAVRAGATW